MRDDEVIYEVIRIGAYAKVSVMHVATLTEAVVTGPASAADGVLRQLARRRLLQMLAKGQAGR